MSEAIHREERAEAWSSATCSAFFGAPELKARSFNLDRYCSRLGYASTEGWDILRSKPKKRFEITGWIHSVQLYHLRPNDNGFAVMLYEEPRTERVLFSNEEKQVGGEEFWLHIPWPNEEPPHGA